MCFDVEKRRHGVSDAAVRFGEHGPERAGRGRCIRRTGRRAANGTRRRGFSLIEVMVVVVIIGMLAGAVALNVGGYMESARVNRAKSDIATIKDAIEAYYLEHSRYPSNSEGLEGLPLENRVDPWGNPYEYNSPGREGPYEVISFGADGREGGEDANADIYSWELNENTEARR